MDLRILKIILCAVIGLFGGAVVVFAISKSNLPGKIREAFYHKENRGKRAFKAIVREKQKDSISCDVFFQDLEHGTTGTKEICIRAVMVSDDIALGDVIILTD